MEPQLDLNKLSALELRDELERWEKRRNALVAAFPYLEDGSASLTAQYAGGPEWDKLAEANSQIAKLTLEIIMRDQAPNSSRGLPPLPGRMEASPQATAADAGEAKQPKSVDDTPTVPASQTMARG